MMNAAEPQLAFIVVSYNTRTLLDACLDSIYRHTQGVPFEIVVVDNASRDGSVQMVRENYPGVQVIESAENLGFGRANNLGFRQTRTPFVMLLNSDAVLLEDTGTALVRFLEEHASVGVVGPAVVLMDGTAQPKTRGMLPSTRVMLNQQLLLCRLFPRVRSLAGLYVETTWGDADRIGWVSGVCMVVRREVYASIGGFDPEIFMYAEDVDLCRRAARAGWETWRVNGHAIKHLCGGSTKSADQVLRNRVLQQRNFLRLLDNSLGPIGRVVSRLGMGAGLVLRIALRGLQSLAGAAEARLAFQADACCFADFVGWSRALPGDCHAHRH